MILKKDNIKEKHKGATQQRSMVNIVEYQRRLQILFFKNITAMKNMAEN